MDFLELTRKARTCRRFDESKPLTGDDLKWLMECARLSPCARNAQELRFITISSASLCNELCARVKWASALQGWNGPGSGEKPTAFIALLGPAKAGELVYIDAGIASQTIQLAASSRGWGCCILYSFERPDTARLLAIPDDLKLLLLLALGEAGEKRVIDSMPKDGSFNYWRDVEGVHHVPKRELEELIIAAL